MDLEYHKGRTCKYKPIICQEGYCSECAIYYQAQFAYEFREKVVKELAHAAATTKYVGVSLRN